MAKNLFGFFEFSTLLCPNGSQWRCGMRDAVKYEQKRRKTKIQLNQLRHKRSEEQINCRFDGKNQLCRRRLRRLGERTG